MTTPVVIEKADQVMFEIGQRHDTCRILIDGVEVFRIAAARNISFGYPVAAVRSDDRHSFSMPPSRWGETEE